MPNYRRSAVPGARYFFTLVTYRRQPILVNPESRTILRQVIEDVRQQHPFTIDAWVLLPDHMHCLWTLPDQDADYSRRWGMIKAGFTKQVKPLFQRGARLNQSRQRHREGTIWQRRFWEHQIRDEVDFQRHMDYIHFNPVKHGLVTEIIAWPYSTFHRYVRTGVYSKDWGGDFNAPDTGFGE
ncbi:MAG TPA: transposase [Gammaproteobacteria bacterium]|nr:transposase [Gammaproteobacteria bacterium]